MSKSDLQCSFCGKKKDQTSLLIAGIDAHICDLCIEHALLFFYIIDKKMEEKIEQDLLKKRKS